MNATKVAGAALLGLLLAACAVGNQEGKFATTGSLKPRAQASTASPSSKNPDEALKAFCAKRHVEYQSGKAPGGATSLAQKQADDRRCEAVGQPG